MLDHHILEKTYVFADDDTAEQFIDQVNEFSESMDHNAVITQDNAEVKLQITTNDVKGLTILDFEFALRSDDAADKLDGESKSHPTNAVNEDQEKYILYLNDKPVSVYTSSIEANNQAKMIAQKYPTARITVKKEVCTLTPMQLEENLRDWFGKGKQGGAGGGGWDRYNTKGERIGKCGDRKPGEGKPKCLSKSKAAALRAKGGKKAIAAAVRRKRAKDTNPERKGSAINVSNKI
jgi:pterin-4a-carbinolamine dehydratase